MPPAERALYVSAVGLGRSPAPGVLTVALEHIAIAGQRVRGADISLGL
jgi:hypothetical protein